MALNLALLAVPLSFVNPRAARSINLLFAVLAYLTYSNLLSIVQAWVAQGKLRFEIGWWVLHAVMAALIALLYVRRTTLRFGMAGCCAMIILRRYLGREVSRRPRSPASRCSACSRSST